jgi:hypothetical protein
MGSCSSTGIEFPQLTSASIGYGDDQTEWCATLTSKECVTDDKLDEKSAGAPVAACKSEGGEGRILPISTTIAGRKSTQAIVIKSKNSKAKVAIILVPCSGRLKKYPVAANKDFKRLELFRPATDGVAGAAIQGMRNEAEFKANGEAVSMREEDTGSPAFIRTLGNTYVLGGVIGSQSGAVGIETSAGATLADDAFEMLKQLRCDGASAPPVSSGESENIKAPANGA